MAATYVSRYSYEILLDRIHNPKVGGSIPPPATNSP